MPEAAAPSVAAARPVAASATRSPRPILPRRAPSRSTADKNVRPPRRRRLPIRSMGTSNSASTCTARAISQPAPLPSDPDLGQWLPGQSGAEATEMRRQLRQQSVVRDNTDRSSTISRPTVSVVVASLSTATAEGDPLPNRPRASDWILEQAEDASSPYYPPSTPRRSASLAIPWGHVDLQGLNPVSRPSARFAAPLPSKFYLLFFCGEGLHGKECGGVTMSSRRSPISPRFSSTSSTRITVAGSIRAQMACPCRRPRPGSAFI